MDKIIEKLKNRNYRITRSRQALIEVFNENPSEHFTKEEILEQMRLKEEIVNVMSLYNNLKIFLNESIIKESIFKGIKVYELAESNHAHFYCKHCDKSIDINIKDLYTYNKIVEEKYKMQIEETKIEFTGVCFECQKEINESDNRNR